MATFPTGTYAPAAKSNGQVIQASFFNDPESEIVAIENELRTGLTNPIVLSVGGITQSASTGSNNFAGHSSLATLNVTGGSTLASLVVSGGSTLATLQVTGASTFTGAVTFGGAVTFSAAVSLQVPSVRVSLSADVEFAAATETCLSWDTQDWMVGSLHSTSVNSSRITFGTTGLWDVGVQATLGQAAIGSHRHVRIRMNDTSVVCGGLAVPASSVNIVPALAGSRVRIANTTDYITAHVLNQLSTSRAFANSTTYGPTHFWANRVSV